MTDNEGEALRLQGNKAFKSGDFQAAEVLYTKCIASRTGSEDCITAAFSNRAQARLNLGWPKQALSDATTAWFRQPSSAKAQYRQVSALIALGRHTRAERVATNAAAKATDPKVAAQLRDLAGKARAMQALRKESRTAEKRLDARVEAKAWTKHKDMPPPESWFPVGLRQGWRYVPAADGNAQNLMLLLHGRGDTAEPYAMLAKTMALPQTASISLMGPQKLDARGSHAGRCWFRDLDDDWNELPEEGVTEGFEHVASTLKVLIDNLHSKGGWPYNRIHLFGFSQGGSVALILASQYRNHIRLGSCTSISGPFLGDPWHHGSSNDDEDDSLAPMLMTYGSSDEIIPRHAIENTFTKLWIIGVDLQLHQIPGKGHAMVNSEAEMRHLMTFWAKNLKSGPPAALHGESYIEVSSPNQPRGFP